MKEHTEITLPAAEVEHLGYRFLAPSNQEALDLEYATLGGRCRHCLMQHCVGKDTLRVLDVVSGLGDEVDLREEGLPQSCKDLQ